MAREPYSGVFQTAQERLINAGRAEHEGELVELLRGHVGGHIDQSQLVRRPGA
ncbi:hypothetical protein [Streptomyces sp. NPDC058621]|uniref:hypothetical protein n=1 Tax=Streptomyces sp. NPDC058621 TaxID=3346561 RepID=UPI00364C7916